MLAVDQPHAPAAIRIDLGAIFVSLELSKSTWLVTSLSKHVVRASDVAGLMERFALLREKARVRTGQEFGFIVIQEAGLDRFWIHRVLEGEAIESYVVDPLKWVAWLIPAIRQSQPPAFPPSPA
jgi:transposase